MHRMRALLLALILMLQVPGIARADVPANIPLNRSFYVWVESPLIRAPQVGPGKVYENWIEGLWLEHGVSAQLDTGGAGRIAHTPLSIVKPFDWSSPLLFKVFSERKRIDKVRIEFTRLDPKSGGQVVFWRIELANVILLRIRDFTQGTQLLEEVVFAYQQMRITNIEKATEWISTWRDPT